MAPPEHYPCFDDDMCMGKKAPSIASGKFVQGEHSDLVPGKINVVVFFAKYDAGASHVLSSVEALHVKHSEVSFFGVSLDPDASHVESFLKGPNKFSFPAIFDEGKKINVAYRDISGFTAIGIPHLFLIDSHGNIVWHEQFSQRKDLKHGQFAEQLENLIAGKALVSNGKAPKDEDDDDDGEEMGGDIDVNMF
eukprot:comp15343_c0_seq1/m.23213 comp15343_c0_seq1/g.23213  ORF comp15343_c0_seq1/g.23213 comp15343_c0_seq1/m.23213 type:complete len:193 (+) comp15343_c0_seq1:33-611(+)